MSLTQILKGSSDLSKEFHNIFNEFNFNLSELTESILKKEIKAKYILKDYTLASITGGAFDYLSRFIIAKHQFKVSSKCSDKFYEFNAYYGLETLISYTMNENNIYEKTYNTGLKLIKEYVENDVYDDKKLFDRIIGVSVYFAKLEQIYRSGYSTKKENSLKYRINKFVYEELKTQSSIMIEDFKNKFKIDKIKCNINYNPIFNECSLAVGGADADIIINNELIDFKTTKNLNNIKKDLEQVFFYYLFSKILEKKGSDIKLNKIHSISLYYSRYGAFVEYIFLKEDNEKIEKAIKKLSSLLNI